MGYCVGCDRFDLFLVGAACQGAGVEALISYCGSGYCKKVAPVETGAVTKTNCL